MSDDFTPFLVIPALAAFAVYAVRSSNAEVGRFEANVADVGKRLNLTFVPRSGPWYAPKPMRLEGTIDHCAVLLDTYWTTQNRSSVLHTRVTARTNGAPVAFKLHLTKQTVVSVIGSALGAQDVVVGDALFDQAFVVKTNDPDLARELLVRPHTTNLTELSATTNELEVHVTGNGVIASCIGPIVEPGPLMDLIHRTASLARAPAALLARWTELAELIDGSMGPLDSWTSEGVLPRIEIDAQGVTIRVAARPGGVRITPVHPAIEAIDRSILAQAGVRVADSGAIEEPLDAKRIRRAVDAIVTAAGPTNALPYRG